MGLKRKLATIWELEQFKIIPIGKDFFNIFVNFLNDQSMVMSIGTVNLRLGIFVCLSG